MPNPTKQTGISLFLLLALQTSRVSTATFEHNGKALKASSDISFGYDSSS
jgi:hypothetical protein